MEVKNYVCKFRNGSYFKRPKDIFVCQVNSTSDIEKATHLSLIEAEIVEYKYGAVKELLYNN